MDAFAERIAVGSQAGAIGGRVALPGVVSRFRALEAYRDAKPEGAVPPAPPSISEGQHRVARRKVICRPIREDDLDAVADLLVRGFPTRSRRYWTDGFERQRRRAMPPDWPRFGVVLDAGGTLVGVILMLFTAVRGRAGEVLRCNLSSWYIEPAFVGHAGTLVLHALRNKKAVYTNISPVPHTIPTVEAVGFRRYARGQFFSMPLLGRSERPLAVHVIEATAPKEAYAGFPDRDLLIEHAAMDCLSVVVEAADGLHPFVFMPFRIRSGRLPLAAQQLVFCRDVSDLARFRGAIARILLRRRGALFVVQDAEGPVAGAVGFFRRQRTGRYARGDEAPRIGDLAYSERVIFGP